MGFVDLHAHVLPAIDDGARDLSESVTLLRGLAGLGYSEVCATPHQKVGSWLPARETIDAALAEVRGAIEREGVAIDLSAAAENFWDPVFVDRGADLSFPRYRDGHAFLFEVPVLRMPLELSEQLFRFQVRGVLPVMAHPERYLEVQQDPERCREIGRRAALVIDLGALDGAHGRAEKKTARRLVERGLAHAAASDLHRADHLREVERGIAWLRKQFGDAAVQELCEDNPRRILRGDLPETQA